jgi:hypothetical protein
VKYVTASVASYDAAVGRVEAGKTYFVEDDKAERWIAAGVARAGNAPQQAPAAVEPEDDGDEGEDTTSDDDDRLREEAHKLSEGGASQRTIGEQLNISRATVRRLLAS